MLSESSFVGYDLGNLEAGSDLTATLAFYRQVGRFEEPVGTGLDADDQFLQINNLANLDLLVFRNGELIAQSIAPGDTVEHLTLVDLAAGDRYA